MTTPHLNEVSQMHAYLCSALADPTRILLLYLLYEGPSHVTGLAERLQAPQSTISRHLKVLRERGLVRAERKGQMVVYSLSDQRVIQALELMREVMADLVARRAEMVQQGALTSRLQGDF